MKTERKNKNSRYEYNSLIVIKPQVEGYYLTKRSIIRCPNGCYDFNDANFYFTHKFADINESYKYYEKLDIKTFDEVLNFINKIGGWRVHSITPIIEENSTNRFLYTFERKI